MKTLIVEDDFTSRLFLQTVLSRYGECHIAVNGKEAVDAFRLAGEAKQTYDLICMDIMMPEMDGQAAMRAIREQEAASGIFTKGVKIVMTTALADIKDVSKAFQGLCDAYLTKPISARKLIENLRGFGLVQ
jgi:two-component system, chemotaxis family, chemotaxis protein CheY